MVNYRFHAAMTEEELLDGEARHSEIEQSRKLVMAAGLTKNSNQLSEVWESDPESYQILLRGAVAAYDQNVLVEELLRGAIARLVSVVDQGDILPDLHHRCQDIVTGRIEYFAKS